MPVKEKDKDLFAGFEVDGESAGVPAQDKDLFSGFEIGGRLVSPTELTTPQEKARSLGAVGGVALTQEQQQSIAQGETITATPRTLDPSIQYRPVPKAEGQPSVESFGQGALNIGGGIATVAGKLLDKLGVEGANKFLADLEVSQNIEGQETDIVTKDAGVQRFISEVLGETVSIPIGGGSGGAFIRAIKGFISGGVPGFLSATGRNEDPTDVAIETAMGAGAGAITEVALAAREASKVRADASVTGVYDVARSSVEDAASNIVEAQAAAAQTGIRTLPAQQTLDPFQLETQAFVGQSPEVSRKAFSVLKQQNRESANAVDGLLNIIASPVAPSTAPTQARTAAGNIIESVVLIRREFSSPIYKQAFRRQRQGKTPLIDTSKFELKAQKEAAQFDSQGQVSKNITAVLDKVSRAEGDLSKLHNAKLEIDQIIDARAENPIGSTTKRFLTDLQTDLVDIMTDQSPSYRAARDEFRRNSQLVDEVRDGVFGRIAALKDKDLKRASAIIFDATESNPQITINAIRTLKNVEGGSEIAAGLLRTELEKRLGRMKSELGEIATTGGRKAENIPANLLTSFFGNAKQKKMLFGALNELNPQALTNAKWLEKSLVRAAAGRPGGSQTAIRGEIKDNLKSGITSSIRDFFRAPLDTVVGVGENAAFRTKVQSVGEALYDPDWSLDMEKIRKLDPNSREAQSQFSALLDKIAAVNAVGRTGSQAVATSTRGALNDEETE